MECIDVIITYCWNRVGYNILKSLVNRGLKVVVGDVSSHNICSMSKYAYNSFSYPNPFENEEEFISVLLENIAYYKPKILIPTHDEGIIIAKYKDRFPKELVIPIDSHQKLLFISNKYNATQVAQKVGVPTPEIYKSKFEIKEYPIVFKTVFGNSAKDVYFPNSQDELEELLAQYKKEDTFMQEMVQGVDHSVDCIRMGSFFYATVYRALITKTHGGGTTTQRIIVNIPQLCDYAKKILDEVDYFGVCGLDFKFNPKTKRVAFIEVNARYTGGLATPIASGFDIPYIHYTLALEENKLNDTIEKPKINYGTKTKWILGDIITLIERLVTFSLSWKDLKSVFDFNFDAFDDFDSNDKIAFWGECKYYLNKLWKNKNLNS